MRTEDESGFFSFEEKLKGFVSCENPPSRNIKKDVFFPLDLLGENECLPPVVSYTEEVKVLHDFQREAVRWLADRFYKRRNVIIADEMGLGKTLESLAFICWAIQNLHTRGPFLVIVPVSVLDNWKLETLRFCPSLQTLMYAGEATEREEIRESLIRFIMQQPKEAQADPKLPFNLLITTYEVAMIDFLFLSNFHWRMMIVDEAHRLKNPKSKLHQILCAHFVSRFIILLTGTPIQNNLSELWSMLNFLHGEVFDDLKLFLEFFSPSNTNRAANASSPSTDSLKSPPDKPYNSSFISNQKLMQDIIQLLLLRRTHSEVLPGRPFELLGKTEYIVFAPLLKMQRTWYKWLLTRDPSLLLDSAKIANMAGSISGLTNLVAQLRKCCNHPYLFNGAEPEPFEEGDHIWKNSGKMVLLDKLLVRLRSEGSRVLIFSGSTKMLDIIQDYFTLKSYTYERLDGSMRGVDRYEAINNFTSTHSNDKKEGKISPTFAFLLSTRAACVGLNLSAADAVILFDFDWNPHVDQQAIARAYRQNQQKHVKIYRFLVRQSVEEVIWVRAQRKLKLSDEVLRKDEADLSSSSDANRNMLREMIGWGVSQIFDGSMEEGNCMKEEEFINSDIDDILRKTEEALPDSLLKGFLYEKSEDVDAETLKSKDAEDSTGFPKKTGNLSDKSRINSNPSVYTFEGKEYVKVDRRTEFRRVKEQVESEVDLKIKTESKLLAELAMSDYAKNSLKTEADKPVRIRKPPEVLKASTSREQRWKNSGYSSCKLQAEDDASEADREEYEINGCMYTPSSSASRVDEVYGGYFLHYKVGSATQLGDDFTNFIILHCVDDSGRWPKAGFFSAISSLSNIPAKQYMKAKAMGDLHFADVHFIHLSELKGKNGYVALCVCQRYQSWLRDRSLIDLTAFTESLTKIKNRARRLGASLHLPRIGATKASSGYSNQWYSIERLLQKLIASSGVHTYVYYYKKGANSQKLAEHTHSPVEGQNGSDQILITGIAENHPEAIYRTSWTAEPRFVIGKLQAYKAGTKDKNKDSDDLESHLEHQLKQGTSFSAPNSKHEEEQQNGEDEAETKLMKTEKEEKKATGLAFNAESSWNLLKPSKERIRKAAPEPTADDCKKQRN